MLDRIEKLNTYNQLSNNRLLIVFCLDSSVAEVYNVAVKNFIEKLKQEPKLRNTVEISFTVFSTGIETDTEFIPLNLLKDPVFNPMSHDGVQIVSALLRTLEKIDVRREWLANNCMGWYTPVMVLITAGNPDRVEDITKYNQSLSAVRKYCDINAKPHERIIPFIVGVGDAINTEALNNYSKGFAKSYFPVDGTFSVMQNQIYNIFRLLRNTTRKIVYWNDTAGESFASIQSDMNCLMDTLVGE